jgi:hypothetical protein
LVQKFALVAMYVAWLAMREKTCVVGLVGHLETNLQGSLGASSLHELTSHDSLVCLSRVGLRMRPSDLHFFMSWSSTSLLYIVSLSFTVCIRGANWVFEKLSRSFISFVAKLCTSKKQYSYCQTQFNFQL